RGGVAHHACVGAAGNYLIPGRFAMPAREFETVLYREEGAVGWITLNRPEQGNMFNAVMLAELRTVLEDTRLETRTRVLVLTGAGDRFFCLGGDKEGLAETYAYPGVLPVLDVYDLIVRHPKPFIASVHGFAVGGRNALL